AEGRAASLHGDYSRRIAVHGHCEDQHGGCYRRDLCRQRGAPAEVDGDHTEIRVADDIVLCRPWVYRRNGGFLADDTLPPGIEEAITLQRVEVAAVHADGLSCARPLGDDFFEHRRAR